VGFGENSIRKELGLGSKWGADPRNAKVQDLTFHGPGRPFQGVDWMDERD